MNTPAIRSSLPSFVLALARPCRLGAVVLAAMLVAGQSAHAAAKTWSGTTDANWATGTNWGGAVPVTGDSLTFTSATGAGGLTLSDNLMTPGTFSILGITFNAGSGAYIINPATAGTNGFTLTGNVTNSSTSLQTINDLITTTAVRTFTMTTGGGDITLGGNISGTAGGILTAGAGTLTLSGSNSYTGATTVANGTTLKLIASGALSSSSALTLNSGSTLAMRSDTAATFTAASVALASGASVIFDVNQLTSGSNNTLTLGGAVSITGNNTINVTGGNGYTLALGALTSTTGSNTVTINPTTGNLSIASFTGNGGGGTTVNLTGSGNTTFTGAITSGSGRAITLNLTGTGVVTLSGTNSLLNGSGVTMSAGTLNFNNVAALGGAGSLSINGGTLDNTSGGAITSSTNFTQNWTANFAFTGTNSLNMGSGAVTLGGSRTVTVGANTLTTGAATGVGTYGITKAGSGTLTLGGFAVTAGGAANIGDTAGAFNLGAVTRATGGTADFSGSNISGIAFSGTAAVASGATTGNILVSAASNGTAYATANNGATWATVPSAGTVGALATYATGTGNYTSLNNVDVTAGDSVSGVTVNTLRFNAASTGLTLAGTNVVNTGGILVTPGSTGATITGGTLTGNATANREVVVHDYGTLNIGSVIANNGAATALTLTGTGTTTLSGANTFTGAVSINQGTTKLGVSQVGTTSSALGVGNTGAPTLTVATGATLDLNGFSQTINGSAGTGTILNSTGTTSTLTIKNGAFSPSVTGGNINLISDVGSGNQFQPGPNVFSGFSGTITQRSGTLRSNNNIATDFGTAALLVLDVTAGGAIGSQSGSTGQTFMQSNRLYLNVAGTLGNNIRVDSNGYIQANSTARTLSGNITGTGALTNALANLITFTGNNSAFAGAFVLAQEGGGQYIFNSTNASSASAKYIFSTDGNVATGTQSFIANIAGGGTVNMGELTTQTGISNASLTNNVAATTAIFSVGALNTSSTYAGKIVNGTGTSALTKVGTGSLTLTGANTYTGLTAINAGVVNAGIADVASTSGALGNGGDITFGGGTLQYSAASAGTDYSSRIKNSTAGAIAIDTNGQAVTYGTALASSNTGGLTLNDTAVTKGSLTLTSANTYSGNTTISAGTLALGLSGSFANSPVINLGTSGSQGILNLTAKTTGFTIGSTQTLSGYGSVNIGTGVVLTVNGTLAPGNNGAGIVNVTGNLALGSSSTSNFEITGRNSGSPVAGTDFDQAAVSGAVTFDSTLNIATTVTGLVAGDSFGLFSAGTTYGGHFTSVAMTGTYAPTLTYDGLTNSWTGSDLVNNLGFTFSETNGSLLVTAIPEPATYAAIFGALALAGVVYRRRRSS